VSFSKRILVGVLAGIAVGVFLGERAAPFGFVATAFVKLLQITVLPYMTVSIVLNLGRLDYATARTLGLRAGAVLLGFWGIALLLTFLFPIVFPAVESARFFSTTIVEPRTPFNFIELYIPSNPFYSLANNVVPAVVLFSILLGVALMGMEKKSLLLDVLAQGANVLSRTTKLITRLTPYGLFAIAASSAGTLDLEQLGRLQVYLVSYMAVALLLSLWILPGLVAALTPIKSRELLARCRDALVTAFMASDLFIVLPMLIEASKDLLRRHELAGDRGEALPDVLVSASFNFPSTGKLLTLSFLLFAGWFADTPVAIEQYPSLAIAGMLTFFGSLNAAVPFLLDVFRIPADTFQLFLATGVINSHFGALIAAVHTVCLALLASVAVTGALRFDPVRLLRYGLITAALAIAVFGGSRLLFDRFLHPSYEQRDVLLSMRILAEPVEALVRREPPPSAPATERVGSTLELVRERGVLRVGYIADGLPFSFFNGRDELVGYDVDLAYRLAGDLGVKLELVPVERERLVDALQSRSCDLIIGGIAVTAERAERLAFSSSYMDETLALIVPDHRRDEFVDWETIRSTPGLVLAAPNVSDYLDKVRALAPAARIDTFDEIEPVLADGIREADAIFLTAERGSTWTLLYPQLTVVVPEPGLVKVPLAYPLAQDDQRWRDYVDLWLELKRKDGTLDALYRYWILGQDAVRKQPRWSVIRDVLHWVD
jgi:Na+/H+-dicarboxylate symporter/ABC-type amino acid transport substrate-binding protein